MNVPAEDREVIPQGTCAERGHRRRRVVLVPVDGGIVRRTVCECCGAVLTGVATGRIGEGDMIARAARFAPGFDKPAARAGEGGDREKLRKFAQYGRCSRTGGTDYGRVRLE